MALLRAGGIEAINIDLIAGLPFQTAGSWAESLEWTACLDPQHVSVYMLEIDEDSRLGKEILSSGSRYGASEVPPEEEIAEMYETAVEFLGVRGWERYEISNFARPGFQSAHNLKYWRLEPYVGFGADAHSFDGVIRRQNVESPAEYVRRVEAVESPVAESAPAHLDDERFYVGLRLSEGVDADWSAHAQPVRRFIEDGLLESDGNRLRLTPRGVLLSNEVFAEFVTS
jgi:oxygen-independent coproporphyrinogen-3 oxidase